MSPRPRPTRSRGSAAGALAVAVALTLTACTSPVQPEVAVRCAPKSIEIDVTNVSDEVARYTVSIEIDRAGLIETEQYSSNDVRPGETVTLTDERPDDAETCTVSSVQVFTP